MIGHPAWQGMKSGLWVGIILFLAGGIGAQAAPEVSSFKINNGAVSTMNPAVTLPNVCEGAASSTHSYMASESADFTGATWKPYAAVPLFILSGAQGTKTVYFKVKDSSNAESAITSDTITLGGEGYSVVGWGYNNAGQCDPSALNSDFVGIAAGFSHSLGLKSYGSIVALGRSNNSGECTVPLPNTNFVAVAAGYEFSVGLKSDGSVVAWGSNTLDRCSIPSPNSDFVAISTTMGLKSNGSIVLWGHPTDTTLPSPNSDFVAVSERLGSHSLALKSDGSIVAWGNNDYGQCTVPPPNRGFVAVATGDSHSLGLKSDGSVVAWGRNAEGQCTIPSSNNDFVSIAAGHGHSLGVKSDGSIVAWGSNLYGQSAVPSPNSDFVAVSGSLHSLALVSAGALQVTLAPPEAIAAGAGWRLTSETAGVWYDNTVYDPVRKTSSTVLKARVGSRTLTFKEIEGWTRPSDQQVDLTTTGTTYVTAQYDQIFRTLSAVCSGNGTLLTSPSGTRFPHGTTITLTAQPAAGYWFDHWTGDVPESLRRVNPLVVRMDADKTVGTDFESGPLPSAPVISKFEINNGTTVTLNPTVTLPNICTGETSASAAHYMVSESPDFTDAVWKPYGCIPMFRLSNGEGEKTVYFKVKNSAGVESSVTSDTLVLLGEGGYPVVAWGSTSTVPSPNLGFISVARARMYCLGLKSDGSIVEWGPRKGVSQLSDPAPNRGFVAIAAGPTHCLGLKSDGSVAAWGNNAYGQCNVPFPNHDFVAIAAGESCSLGIKSDGSIVAWGSNNWGLCDVPVPNRDFVAVSVGVLNCLGLKSDGSIVLWGQNAPSPPTPNREFKAIAAGNYNALALKSDGSILMRKSAKEWGAPFSDKGFVAIASGEQANLGLKSDGSIVMFDGGCIYSNTPSPNTGFVAIAAGGADFLALANEGDLRVTVTPPEAVAESDARRPLSEMAGQWRLAYEKATVWHKSGASRLRGKQTITFREIYGWIKPADRVVEADVSTTVTVTAQYTPATWTLSTTCGANGSLQQSPAGTQFPHGSTVTLTAQPAAGSWFDRWTGDVPAGLERVNPLTLIMDADKTIGADFATGPIPSAPVISSFKINNGAATTVNPAVILTNTCTGETSASAAQYLVSESSDFAGATWRPYGSVPLFTLSGGDGVKTVYFKVKNSAEVESAVTSDTISLVGSGASVVVWGGNSHGQGVEPPDNVNFVAISAGEKHNLGLKSDGSIVAWGGNYAKQCSVPAPNRDFVAVSAGYYHSLGLKSDGSVVAWGENGWGQCSVPLPNRDFVAVSAGYYFSLGLKSDGSVVAWGRNDYGQCTVPISIGRCVAISAGPYHCLALKANGSIAAWGNNNYKQCDLPLANWSFVAISAVGNYGFALKPDGSMVAMGDPTYSLHQIPTPNVNYSRVSVGRGGHCLGLKPDGSIIAWGSNGCGQCNVSAPNIRYLDVSAGGEHSLALLRKSEGTLRVTLAPSEAVAAGARWRLAGKTVWSESATTITCNAGTYTLELLDDLPGWYATPTTQTITIQQDELTTATGTYVPGQTWPLSVTAENGTVIKSPSKTNYRAGETVKLTATPAAGYHFTGWSGSTSGTTNPLAVVMDSPKTLTANFAINEYALTVQAANGSVARAPEQATYNHGTIVSLTASPATGFLFDRWAGDVPAGLEQTNPLILTMDGSKTIQAVFRVQPVPVISSFKINNGAATTVNPAVTLANVCGDATSVTHSYMASESADFTSATWKPYAPVPLFVLSPVAGTKTVYLRIRDNQSDTDIVTSDTIVLGSPGSVVAWGNDGLGQCDVPSPNQGFVALSNGLFHGLGLTSDGSIRAWGSNGGEVSTLPSPNSDFVAIASGDVHNLALKSDGSVVAWGSNDYGQSNVPLPNRDFVAVADGYHHCLGLKSDGSIIAWGANSDWQGNYMGQSTVPYPNTGFVAVSAGKLHSLGLKSGGAIVAWGSNAQGQCNVPTPNSDFIAIVAEENFSLGLKSDGSIVAWGENADSQCNVPSPNSGFVSIAAGIRHGLGLKSDGSIRAWGSNSFGQTAVPEPNAGFMAISAGGSNSFALASGGMGRLKVTLTPPESVAAGAQWRLTSETAGIWHNSGDVVRARGNTTQTLTFKAVYGWNTPPDQAVYLANDDTVPGTGEYRRVNWTLSALCENGSIEASPSGSSFPHGTVVQLTARPGQGYWFDRWTGDVPAGLEQANPLTLTMDANKVIGATLEPFPVFPEVSNFSINNGAVTTLNPTVILFNSCRSASSATHSYMASESADFTSATWKPYAALSLFTLSRSNGTKTIYYKVKDGANVESAVTSDTITLGDTGYFAVAWGTNDHLQCRVPGLNGDFSSVVAGRFHSLGLKSDGSVLVWGQNDYGQAITPAPNRDFIAVAAGWNHNLGLKSDGSIFAWGYNADGQCRVPVPNSGFVGLASGANHSVGLKSDGSVVVWGSNFAGQCNIPVPNSGFVAVSAGYGHSLGLKSDGSIVAWGYNDYGQCSVPEPNRGFVVVMAGGNHSLGLRADGSIAAWGDNRDAQCQIPLPNSGFVAVAAGGDTSLALKADGAIVTLGAHGEGQNAVPAPNSGYVAIAAGGLHSFALASQGAVQVKLAPPEAIAAGARWRLTDEVNKDIWHDETVYDPATQTSGTLLKSRVGSHTVTFDDIAGWVTPPDRQVELTTTETAVAQGEYKRIYCSLWTQCSNGSVQMAPAGPSFPYGTTVTLTATPAAGYHFTGWSGAVISTENPLNVVMDSTKTLTANFEENVVIEEFALTVDVVGRGSVTKLPDQTSYVGGMVVTLTATPAPGYYFVGWSGAITGQFSPLNVTMDSTKTLTATFAANEYALTVEAVNGTVTKSPDQAAYAHGTTVTLTATAAAGYQFAGWSGATTSTLNPLDLVMDATKTLTANFESVVPTSVTAVGNTYRVLVSWAPVTSVTSFVVTRTAGDDVTSWTVTATEFADDTALPGVTYAYTVAAVDAQGTVGTPSAAVTASVTAETFTAAAYKVTAKGYAMTRDLPTTGGLSFAAMSPKAGTIKIAALKKLPANAVDNVDKGIYYLKNQGQVSTLAINGDVKTLSFDVPVYSLEATGLVKSVSAKSVTFLSAREFGTVSVAATKASEDGRYARTFVETTAAASATPMTIKTTGAVVEELATTQPVKLLNVASKVYKDAAKAKKTSLGAVGSLPKVVAEISNTPPPQSEATPCSIQGHTLNFVTVSDGPIVADEIVGAIDKVTVSGGNLRAGLIQSSKNITLLQATSKKVNGVNVGGAVGTAGQAPALVVKAQPPMTGKSKVAITKVYGQTGVAGYFYAGYDTLFQKGGIGIIQTTTGGKVEGAAFLDPALAAKMKVLSKGQTIAINPSM